MALIALPTPPLPLACVINKSEGRVKQTKIIMLHITYTLYIESGKK